MADFAEYDPTTDSWMALPDMPFVMSAHHAVVIGDAAYCFGDYTRPDLVARYDFKTRVWSEVQTDYLPARHAAVAALNGSVYVFGGNRGEAGLDFIQRFDGFAAAGKY